MEPLKIRRKSKTIPFGFKLSSDPSYLEPIQTELDALNEAKKYIKADINAFLQGKQKTAGGFVWKYKYV